MKITTPQHLSELQKNPKNIRNICILAHVDHGKTTIADALVASNGIISQRLAGKLRYMDSREDEQLRGITMKSSAISLLFTKDEEEYIVNLIDSPGHVDFSSEVSTAVRLCDGAVVVVDVVEGVCPQTHVVLRQAWLENIRPCLVLNKIDRLITELKYSPVEAHFHLQQILEKVNAITAALFTTDVLEKSTSKTVPENDISQKAVTDDVAVSIDDWSSGLEETDDSSLYFSPDLGNVVFSSAIDGWGFSINDFAKMYSSKLGINEGILNKTLWGDYYLHGKSKRIFKGAQAKAKKPLFVQFVLENLWAVYDAVLRKDKVKTDQIVKSLNLKISARDSRHTDGRVHLKALFDQWLPLSSSLLAMVIDKLPSPMEIHSERVEKLMCSGLRTFDSLPAKTQSLKKDFLACSSSDDDPIIVFVSKMFAVDESALPKHRKRPLTQEEIAARREHARQRHAEMLASNSGLENGTPLILEPAPIENDENENSDNRGKLTKAKEIPKSRMLAFARVYSGTVKKGQQLYVLGPKHDPRETPFPEVALLNTQDPSLLINSSIKDDVSDGLSIAKSVDRGTNQHVASFIVQDLYLLMGRELENLDSVPAGNVLGIGGLESHVLKSATISSTVACPPFTALPMEARPIVRLAVEPVHPADMPALIRGLRLLNQADPCVETFVQETGEHVIVGAGEVHLQRCIDDLEQRFAGIKLNVSAPIVPFRETIVRPPTVDRVNEAIVGETSSVQAKQIDTEEGSDGNKNVLDKEKGLIEIKTANRLCTLHMRATPLPTEVAGLLENKSDLIKVLVTVSSASSVAERKQLASEVKASTREALKFFYQDLCTAFKEAGSVWHGAADDIWSFGPRRIGSNVLLNRIPGYRRASVWQNLGIAGSTNHLQSEASYRDYDNSIVSGFQLATLAGPLCEEPLMGVCFVIEEWTSVENDGSSVPTGCPGKTELEGSISSKEEEPAHEGKNDCQRNFRDSENTDFEEALKAERDEVDEGNSSSEHDPRNGNCRNTGEKYSSSKKLDRFGPFSGQLMSAVKEGCRRAFLLQPVRLMAAMYTCEIQATAEVLGRMYAVVAKREGRVLKEEMKEGSDVFDVTAVLPVAESFGFAEEIRKRTSGLANPQLVFSHWEVVDIDPFWVPTTEEEYTHFGEKADSENQARKYMNSVRRRKGLYVEEKTVEHAEKQRTLKK
ncbi:elongation factor-like GTPase 1 isoform X1 [Montipora foliosa]|uniref:elongation factor-like GTPase 1 isoform X1 n=1 Tax=Montipora foliosa TaxID=591990 RepID=UPI0035F1B2A2